MLNFLSTLGADTQFQKNRLILIKPSYDAPNQQALRTILHSFAGEDEQTRAQIAFATIVKKVHLSYGKENWVYLLKNLIILDRVMSDNRFCEELAETTLATVTNYTDRDVKAEAVNAKFLLRTMWQLVQDLSRLKTSSQHILYYKRSQRKAYLDRLSPGQIFAQIKLLQRLFDTSLSLISLTSGISSTPDKSQRQTQIPSQKHKKLYIQFVNSPLAQYLNMHIYSKLLTFFSCQYLCIHQFIQLIMQTASSITLVSVDDAKVFKKIVMRFKHNCMEMKLLVERNKHKKGFDSIDTKEFTAFNEEHIVKVIDQYISQHSSHGKFSFTLDLQTMANRSCEHVRLSEQRFVDKKPLILRTDGLRPKTPRKIIQLKKNQEEEKAFSDYFNSYSDEFPHKNMMTIDLIEHIRRDEENMYQQILQSAQQISQTNQKSLPTQQDEPNFFKQFKQLKSKMKLSDILVSGKEEKEKEEDSTSYSFKNSSRGGSLFDVLNLKWVAQKPILL